MVESIKGSKTDSSAPLNFAFRSSYAGRRKTCGCITMQFNKIYMKNIAIVIILGLVLLSCSPTAKLRRAERLIEKAEKAGADWRHDTTFVKVPVFITQITVDTLFVTQPADTVVINKDRLHVKFIDLPGDSIFLEGKCDSLVKYVKVPITVTNIIHAPKPKITWWMFLLAGLLGGFVLALWLRR